jgi:hypothetical protein
MTEHEDERQIPNMTEEQRARQTKSPEDGYPADTTDPLGGLGDDEGQVNADATPKIADDAEKGETATPAPSDDASNAPDAESPRRP